MKMAVNEALVLDINQRPYGGAQTHTGHSAHSTVIKTLKKTYFHSDKRKIEFFTRHAGTVELAWLNTSRVPKCLETVCPHSDRTEGHSTAAPQNPLSTHL